MNVTKDGFKNRQPYRRLSANGICGTERVCGCSPIRGLLKTRHLDFQTENLMEQILHKDNLNKAYKKVKSNRGAGGVEE
ncbi:MAG: hypothetical protein ACLRVS_02165 [Lachnospiraceae bacterium]